MLAKTALEKVVLQVGETCSRNKHAKIVAKRNVLANKLCESGVSPDHGVRPATGSPIREAPSSVALRTSRSGSASVDIVESHT